jgi:hypothetical protein
MIVNGTEDPVRPFPPGPIPSAHQSSANHWRCLLSSYSHNSGRIALTAGLSGLMLFAYGSHRPDLPRAEQALESDDNTRARAPAPRPPGHGGGARRWSRKGEASRIGLCGDRRTRVSRRGDGQTHRPARPLERVEGHVVHGRATPARRGDAVAGINVDPILPPAVVPWRFARGFFARVRNHAGVPVEKLDGPPYDLRLDGHNRLWEIFKTLAKACAGLDAQLVLSLGSRDQAPDAALAGAPVVVPFAPQIELLKRATLAITHAGLNTALESLRQGVPMVAIPITNDQLGVASRLEWLGVAEVVASSRLSVQRLGAAIERVLGEPAYREKAQRYQREIAHLNGLARAADIVDRAISVRKPVLRSRP